MPKNWDISTEKQKEQKMLLEAQLAAHRQAKADAAKLKKLEEQELVKLARRNARLQRGAERSKEREKLKVLAADKELAQRELSRRRLLEFVKRFHGHYKPGFVHLDICRRLERFARDVDEGKSPRLMILMPPRHGKSQIASKMYPAWHLGHYPHHEIIASSYASSLAVDFSREVRGVLRDPAYHVLFRHTRLDPDFQGVENWKVLRTRNDAGDVVGGGGYVAAGVGGGITGKGANVLIIDDPFKNDEEADSQTHRDGVWNWYMSTAYTRLAPGGGVLVIQTWWHDDDLAGRLQRLMHEDPEADQFVVVKYPAVNDGYDEYYEPATDKIISVPPGEPGPEGAELVRPAGSALHAERYDIKRLMQIKKTLTARFWSALYQQNPVPDEGAFFTREQFKFLHTPLDPGGSNVYQAWDFAITEKQQADWVVGSTGYQNFDDDIAVSEIVRFKGDSFKIVEAILDGYAKHKPLLVGVEDGQIWRAIKPLLEKRMKERNLYPAIEVLRPIQDKQARARSLQGRMQQGKIFWPPKATWLEQAMTEMLRFPVGQHDDVVDSLAWLVNLMVGRAAPRRPKAQEPESWRKKLEKTLRAARGQTHMAA